MGVKKTSKKSPKKKQEPAAKKTATAPASSVTSGQPHESRIQTFSREAILPYLASIILIGTCALVFIVYRSFGWAAFLAMLFYVGFDGTNRKLVRFFRGSRNAAAAATLLLVLVSVLGPVVLLGRYLIRELISLIILIRENIANEEILDLALKFPRLTELLTSRAFFWVDYNESYRQYLSQYGTWLDSDRITTWLGSLYQVVSGGINFTADLAINTVFAAIILFFMFRDGSFFHVFLIDALPFPPAITRSFVHRMRDIIRTVLRGNVFVSFLQGAAVALGLAFCGIPGAIVYGVIAGMLSLIPVVGTAMVWFPTVLYLALIQESYILALILTAYCLSMYLLLENIVKPKIMDKKLGIHPLFLFLAILGGITEFGISGVVLGPLIVTLFMTIWSIYHIWGAGAEHLESNDENQNQTTEQ